MNRNKKQLISARQKCVDAKIGETIACPSCGTQHVKKSYQSVFCKSKGGTVCKDNYWNNVDQNKRCNTTRISPASAAWMESSKRNFSLFGVDAPNIVGGSGKITGITSEGYRIMDGIAYDKWDDPVYRVDPNENDHPFSSDALGQW